MSQTPHRKVRRTERTQAVKSGIIAPERRNLTPQEIAELQEIHRIASAKAFEANQVKANTVHIPRSGFLFWKRGGKELAAELEATARLLDDVKRKWIAGRLAACGYPPNSVCDINMGTGEITYSAPKA